MRWREKPEEPAKHYMLSMVIFNALLDIADLGLLVLFGVPVFGPLLCQGRLEILSFRLMILGDI